MLKSSSLFTGYASSHEHVNEILKFKMFLKITTPTEFLIKYC